MEINWSEKNIAELELYFSTDAKKGLTKEQYKISKAQYGENIIDSDLLTRQNFYGLKRKNRNIRAMLSGSVGIVGVLYALTLVVLAVMDFGVNLFIFLPFYVFLSAFSFALNMRAEKKYEYLYKIARPKALVIRDSKRKNVFIENIVPGDLILLSAGDIVPADARVVSAAYLSCIHISESGKPAAEGKTAEILKYNPTEIPANIVCAADVVDYGSAAAVVVATGENTHIAKAADAETQKNADSRDINKTELTKGDEYSFMQKRAHAISKIFFLLSVALSMLIIFSGIMQKRDILTVIMTCAAVLAACFSEQIPIIADFAAIYGMHRMAKSGILIKKTAIIDDINEIDTIIAKKAESFTQNKMLLKRVSDHDPSGGNLYEIGHILSCMAMCSNVEQHRGGAGPVYSGAAVDVAVFEALNSCGLGHEAVTNTYQKIGKTMYNPKNGIKSAYIIKDGKANLICFGEAFNILSRCSKVKGGALDRRVLDFYKSQIDGLYKEYDLVMAVATKDFGYGVQGASGDETEGNLDFLGFAGFAEPKTQAVFESIDYLKKSGVAPVMIAGGEDAHIKNAALKFGIIKNTESAQIIDDRSLAAMGDDIFYINADKFRLFAPIATENRIKLIRALIFKNRLPAVTVNHIEEISLMNERCVSFTSVSAETGILKNKASVITKNLTVSTIVKTLKNAVLIYGNICGILHYLSMLFLSQYLLILLPVLSGGEYILSPFGMIWAGIGAGYLFSVSLCFNEHNGGWHIARNRIKKYKTPKKYERAVLKYGFAYGLLAFACTVLCFFIALAAKEPSGLSGALKKYISAGAAGDPNIKSAQTAALVSYLSLCAAVAQRYIKGKRLFDFGIFKNKLYTAALTLNLTGIALAVFVPAFRDFFGFGEISAGIFGVSAAVGLVFAMATVFFKKNILSEKNNRDKENKRDKKK